MNFHQVNNNDGDVVNVALPAQPMMGQRSTCATCGNAIEYVGPYWRHVGATYRHPARPVADEAQERDFEQELASWRATAPLGQVTVPAAFLLALIRRYDDLALIRRYADLHRDVPPSRGCADCDGTDDRPHALLQRRKAHPEYGPERDGWSIVCGMTDHGGAHCHVNVSHCPWCGRKLPTDEPANVAAEAGQTAIVAR